MKARMPVEHDEAHLKMLSALRTFSFKRVKYDFISLFSLSEMFFGMDISERHEVQCNNSLLEVVSSRFRYIPVANIKGK